MEGVAGDQSRARQPEAVDSNPNPGPARTEPALDGLAMGRYPERRLGLILQTFGSLLPYACSNTHTHPQVVA